MAEGRKLATHDPEHPFMKDPTSWKQNPAIQELLFTAAPVVCEDIETDPRVNDEWREYLKRKEGKRFLAVPILVRGHVRGFVGIRHSDRAAYRPEEIELTQALAHQVMLRFNSMSLPTRVSELRSCKSEIEWRATFTTLWRKVSPV